MSQPPTLDKEHELELQGYEFIAGIDEAGRGALAGPVVAGSVILPRASQPWFKLVRDSKELSPKKRESLFALINREAVAVATSIVSPQIIDDINILRATQLAMKQAVERLPRQPRFLLVDGMRLPLCPIPQMAIIKGDKLCLSIACASIIAKVTRDHIMEDFDKVYPGYSLARHKGYGTYEHIRCLRQEGPSPIHRLSFAPVRNVILNHVGNG
jgi:ribonuclease HII